jgi:hypothetical protein
MKLNKTLIYTLVVLLALALVTGLALAEIGDRPDMFRRNISKTPDQETERANINHMAFYVPAQTSDGLLTTVVYTDAEGITDERINAKPLVAVYIDSLPHEEIVVASGAGLGDHDAFAAVSLDDGATWKRTNLSNSALLSSFTLANGQPYPGDAHNMTFAIAGDKVLVGWISKYCDGGSPLYTMPDTDVDALQLATGLPDLYFRDIWGVAGSQGSVDYTLQGFPEVGEIPYSCVWSARGQLLPVELDDTGTMGYDILWTKAERLTSGRRDANRLEMAGDSAAGFMMTWQEDPEGLRPGQGLGPGEGWSGAVVNQQTDLWYSFISLDNFVMVMADDTDTATPVDIADYTGETMPKVAVPMAMPVRLTDNKMCKETGSDPYCYVDFDDLNPYGGTVLPDVDWDDPAAVKAGITQDGNSTFCPVTVSWTNPGNTTLELCQTGDGRVLQGRVGASRPRVNVQPYATTALGVYDSAIVIMGAEESKALGEGSTDDDTLVPVDIGKNMWYYSFDLLNPEFMMQGGMLNWPAKDPATGEVFEMLEDDFGNAFYETEISRRFSHMSQPIHQFGPSSISSVLIVKQGILNQGGPADIFLRMTKVPDDVVWEDCELDGDMTTTEQCLPVGYNPYAYENLVCEDADGNSMWVYTDGSNPRYLQGLCTSTGINVSSVTWTGCDGDCTQFPWDGGVSPFPKVTMWEQTVDDLDDESWVNPYDVAKGHRGFIDGDFIMMMYAWSPNWKANSVGNDHYNLYARRSFDGGLTWTTTPAALGGDGTESCENYKQADGSIVTTCTTYGAGEFEQARNLSQLIGNKETILDPRYTPTGGLKMLPITDLKEIGFTGDDDDTRDPSKYFIVYETGDNTTVAEGEATPLDLFYSRATNWGDDYDLVEYYNAVTDETTLGFDWLEHDREDLSGEAANTCNNAGTVYYAIWNQWQEDEHENVSDSDAIFRRVWYNPDAEDGDPTTLSPIVRIIYASTDIVELDSAEELLFVGSAVSRSGMGITGYQWRVDDSGAVGSSQKFSLPANTLLQGKHTIFFSALDGNGKWSREVTATIEVIVPDEPEPPVVPVTPAAPSMLFMPVIGH